MFNHRYGLHDATVQGTKTQTRRIIPKTKIEAYYKSRDNVSYVCLPTCQPIYSETLEQAMMRQCPYEVGQVLPIAECYAKIYNRLLLHGKTNDALAFRSELGAEPELQAGWQNKMFVREELMPRAIRIDTIRFQMLQDISEEDCLAEGIVLQRGLSMRERSEGNTATASTQARHSGQGATARLPSGITIHARHTLHLSIG